MADEKRLIDANALVDAIEDIGWYHINAKGKLVEGANPANNTPIYKAFDIYNAIKNAPTVDAVEVVHGKWAIFEDAYMGEYVYQCSVCKSELVTLEGTQADDLWKYCPNCGAKMDGDGNA